MPTFRKHEHLLTPAEFQRVYDRRRSASDAGIILYARENALPHSRIGLSVSRKYGGAVQRNRIKRLYREAFRLEKERLPVGLDFILIPRTQQEPAIDELRKSLVKLAKQVHKKMLRDAEEKPSLDPTPQATGG